MAVPKQKSKAPARKEAGRQLAGRQQGAGCQALAELMAVPMRQQAPVAAIDAQQAGRQLAASPGGNRVGADAPASKQACRPAHLLGLMGLMPPMLMHHQARQAAGCCQPAGPPLVDLILRPAGTSAGWPPHPQGHRRSEEAARLAGWLPPCLLFFVCPFHQHNQLPYPASTPTVDKTSLLACRPAAPPCPRRRLIPNLPIVLRLSHVAPALTSLTSTPPTLPLMPCARATPSPRDAG